MNTREKNRLLNEIIELRATLKEKETLLENAILEDHKDVSTSKGMAKYCEETIAMTFNMTRFKETSPELYKNNLVETVRKAHIRITAKK